MTTTLGRALAALALAVGGPAAHAQDAYPSRPITLVVPFPAGGVVDVVSRIVAEKMGANMKATIVVENRVGAGGTIGATAVARAKPDGYTLLMGGSATHIFGPTLYKNLQYEPVKDFVPIGQVSSSPLLVVVGSKTNASTVPELVAQLKASGDKANYGSNGNGTFPHLAGELFKQANGLQTQHVPYSGGPAALTSLLRGDTTMSINHIPVVQGMLKSGQLRALATTGRARSAAFPALPTLDESGMPGFEANAWFGLFAPAGTPKAIIDRLSGELANAVSDEAVRSRFATAGEEARFTPPAAFGTYVAAELAKWSKVVKDAKLSID